MNATELTNALKDKWERRLADYNRSTLAAHKIYAQELRLCLSDLLRTALEEEGT